MRHLDSAEPTARWTGVEAALAGGGESSERSGITDDDVKRSDLERKFLLVGAADGSSSPIDLVEAKAIPIFDRLK